MFLRLSLVADVIVHTRTTTIASDDGAGGVVVRIDSGHVITVRILGGQCLADDTVLRVLWRWVCRIVCTLAGFGFKSFGGGSLLVRRGPFQRGTLSP